MTNRFEHDVDRLAQEVIDANPGSAVAAAYRAVAMDLFSKAGAAVSAPPQPRLTGDQLLKIALKHDRPVAGYQFADKFDFDAIAQELNAKFFAAAPAQEPQESLVGKIVRVNNPRFSGYGFAQYDSGDHSRVIGVVLENGNTWEYEIETVRAALPEEISQAPKAVQARLRPAQEQPVEDSPQLDDSRCAICGWPLAESVEKGCTRGNCSMRPFPDNIYDPERANKEYKTERFAPSPQRGKP